MYLLLNNYKIIINNLLLTALLIFFQSYFPSITTSEELLLIKFDFLLIYLIYLSFLYRVYLIIFFAFFIGIFQDLLVQSDTIGLYSLLKVLFVYFIGYLKDSNKIWNSQFKFSFLLIVIFSHSFLYHYIFINDINYYAIFYILIESLINLTLLIIIDKVIYNGKIF
jgi:cell shape-determining protein MreD